MHESIDQSVFYFMSNSLSVCAWVCSEQWGVFVDYCKVCEILKGFFCMNPVLFHFQYVRESAMNNEVTEADQPLATSEMDEPDLPLDDDGNLLGMFAGPCEFCHQTILPLPTLEMQQINVGLRFLSLSVYICHCFSVKFSCLSVCVHVTVFLSYLWVCLSVIFVGK